MSLVGAIGLLLVAVFLSACGVVTADVLDAPLPQRLVGVSAAVVGLVANTLAWAMVAGGISGLLWMAAKAIAS
jgi:hypothetical protein